ncbi:MAG TPA: ferritin-like domain-containing protein [Chitinophagaceae bacterium]|nr:ferritin-like domain-containing protein [Chitinophagaceae bacterium]
MAKSSNSKKGASKKSTASKQSTSSGFEPAESKIAATSQDRETGLRKLFADSIKDIYWAENHLVKSLPKLINAASSAELQGALSDHLEVTKQHVSRLEQVFEILGKKAQAKKCDAMEGLSKEAEGVIESTDSGTSARDQGIVMAAQKTEHYEIATYGGLSQLAKTLGHSDISDLLGQTLAEEKEADQLLTTIAANLGTK